MALTSELLPDGCCGKSMLRNLSLKGYRRYLDSVSYLSPSKLQKLLTPGFREEAIGAFSTSRHMEQYFEKVGANPWLSRLQYVDAKTYLPGDILTKVDRMSMANSLEARGPLLDHVLVEYVATLPPEMKLHNGVSKYLLKRVAEKLLPREIVHRQKQGFAVPLEYWFKKDLRNYLRDVLFDSRARMRGILSIAEVERLLMLYEQGRVEMANTLWILLILETWCRIFIDRSAVPVELAEGASVRSMREPNGFSFVRHT